VADDDGHGSGRTSRAVSPGALSALLQDLAAAPASDADARSWEAGLRDGAVIGRFELVRELGRGGFGVVWEARDRELGRRVAFKAVRAGSRRELREERLLREAEAAARLSHPNIVTLYDVGRSEHGPYLVLELLEGETLSARLARGALPPRDALRIAVQIALGLAHAHAHGVVHRDLKPENVFLCEDGQVKVLDFGLAHAFGRRRVDGGTPAYMAPEQSEGSPEDERTDVWALGAILFEMLTGRQARPEAARGRPPAVDVPGMPALGGLLARMLAERPRERPRDAGEVLAALSEDPGRASPTGPVRTRRRSRRASAAVAIAAVAAAIAVAVAVATRGSKDAGARSDGRVLVAVADVANETGERDLDVLSGLLVTSLEQSRRLAVMTQARVLDLAVRTGRKDAARVDETIGREVGKAQRARALLLPAIRRLASTYSVEMRVIDPVRDEHLFTVSERSGSKEALLDVLDRVSERTRRELGESEADLGASRVRLGEAMTRSLEAYQHYRAGLEAWLRDGQRAVGLRELQDALRLDPDFAPVHAELALLYSWYGRPDLAEPHWRAAAALGGAMPEKERLVLEMRQAHWSPSLERWSRDDALRMADAAVKRFPEDKFVLAWAAEAYDSFDVLDRWESALRKALELDPAFYFAASTLSDGLGDRVAEALEVARRAVATRRSSANLALLARALRASGDDAGSAAAALESLTADAGRNSLIAWVACDALHEVGDDAACRPVWGRMASGGANEHERDFARFQLIIGLACGGRVRDALALASSAGDPARAAPPMVLANVHQIGRPRLDAPRAIEAARRIPHLQIRRNFLAWFGAAEEAERISSSLEGRGYEIVEKVNRYYGLVRERKLDEAVELMRAVRAEIHRRNYSGSLYGAALLEAEALLQAGRAADAADVGPAPLPCRCTDRMDYAANYPRLALLRARAFDQLGRSADALRELDGVLAFWKDADAELPLLVEAKAFRKRVARGSPSARASLR
jgi:tetratricopeptide (TPR) repeat protein